MFKDSDIRKSLSQEIGRMRTQKQRHPITKPGQRVKPRAGMTGVISFNEGTTSNFRTINRDNIRRQWSF